MAGISGVNPSSDVAAGRTYRMAFSATLGSAGVLARLRGASGREVWVTRVALAKPSAAVGVSLRLASSVGAGGTAVATTTVALDRGDPTAQAVAEAFSAPPAAGAAVGDVEPSVSLATTETRAYEFPAGALTLRDATDVLEVVLDAGATVAGYVEWIET